jgi:hypothetical protein
MNEDVRQYCDGVSVYDVDEDIRKAVIDRLGLKETSSGVDFVGLIWSGNRPSIFWPKGMSQREDWKTDVRLLVRSLRRAARSSNKGGRKTDSSGQIEMPPEIELLEDYEQNGLFDSRDRNYRPGHNGKIDWGRTIRMKTPVPGKSGSPVYIEPMVGFNSDSRGIIRKLHSYAVGIADEKFSWLLSSDGKPKARELHGGRLPVSRRVGLGLVRSELGRQFSDHKKKQLRLIETFLSREDASGGFSDSCLGITSFHTVWEQMCSSYYGDQKSHYQSPAIPAYLFGTETRLEASNAPRPDAVIRDRDCLAIIDAKYYDFARTKPAWQDLVKQFFYAKAYSNDPQYSRIENVLVLPDTNGKQASHAVVTDRDNVRMDSEFMPIKLVFLNVAEVMSHFVSGKENEAARRTIFSAS